MVANSLIFGRLTTDDYENEVASDPRIDLLRNKMEVTENTQFSRDYLDPEKRAIGNAIQVFFKDGSAMERVEAAYPVGHPRRRAEGIPLLKQKFERNIATRLSQQQCEQIVKLFEDLAALESTPINEFMHMGCQCLSTWSTRSLSDLGLIYCGKAGFGQISRSFSLNSYGSTLRFALTLKRSKNLPQTIFPSL